MVDDDITEHLGSSLTTHLCIITFAALSYYIYTQCFISHKTGNRELFGCSLTLSL